MSQWQAALGAGLQSAGDAVYNFYGMKRRRELDDQDEAFRQEKLALDKAMTDSTIQRNMEELGLRNREIGSQEKEYDRRARHDSNMMGLDQMRLGAEELYRGQELAQRQKEADQLHQRGVAQNATMSGYYDTLTGISQEDKEERRKIAAYNAVTKTLDDMVANAIKSVDVKTATVMNLRNPDAVRQMVERGLQGNPAYVQAKQLQRELMLGLGGGALTDEQLALMQSLGNQADTVPAPATGIGAPRRPGLNLGTDPR